MINEEKLFGNLFDEPTIIPERLFYFGKSVLVALNLANTTGNYTIVIDKLIISLPALGNEIGIVDTSLNIQVGSTTVVVADMAGFKTYMSDNHDVVVKALGGKLNPKVKQFYPHGITEYTIAPQTEMETLTKRVFVAAGANSVALGAALTAELEAFYGPWVADKKTQTVQKQTVTDSRDMRNTNFINLGLDLTEAVHTVAAFNPGKVAICSSFFKFSDLYPHGKQTTLVLSGSIAPEKILVMDNRQYTDNMTIYFKNTSINATAFCYLAAESGDAPDMLGVTIKATKGTRKVPSKYGNLANTFFTIKNLSAVNSLTFILKIKF